MQLTRHADYALRVLLYLAARHEEICSIRQIADTYDISHNHLMKVVHELGKAGFVTSERGRYGGVKLSRIAGKINIGDVLRVMEKDLQLAPCGSCALQRGCGLQGVLGEALAAFLAVLDRYSLKDIQEKSPQIEKLLAAFSADCNVQK